MHPKKWLEICEKQNVFETAFEADRLSAAFSGEGSHAGLAGVCGNLPDCDNCKLSLERNWYATEGNSEKMAIEEKIQRNKISTVDISELMQWLLSSNPEEAKALQNSLNAEAHTAQRLEQQTFTGTGKSAASRFKSDFAPEGSAGNV